MIAPRRKIFFVHEGKEAYPELAAYRSFFAGAFETQELTPQEATARPDMKDAICWMIMGFRPHRPTAAFVIHDYRSLSVGRLAPIKDFIKKHFNAKPDLRLFQNAAMRDLMGFRDSIPTLFLPMGVPPEILDRREEEKPEASHDFCYIGVMSKERRTNLMLDSFLSRFGATKTFFLYGAPDDFIAARYRAFPNIVFQGCLPQRELFPRLRQARVAVNYFPAHRPHVLQTPTKLLEYGALGLRILSNEQPQSRETAARYGISSFWGPNDDMFRDVPETLAWPDNDSLDASVFLWPSVIAQSGIGAWLDKAVRA